MGSIVQQQFLTLLQVAWIILLIVVACATIAAIAFFVRRWLAVARFQLAWASHGKDVLLVYSDSPHWREYIERNWLAKWGARAVVLNWSERRNWDVRTDAGVALFRAYAGSREFNPLAIVMRGRGRVQVVRFWRAFRDVKHGNDAALRYAERELDAALTGGVTPMPRVVP